MARIKNLGELNFFQQIEVRDPIINNETGEVFEKGVWVVVFNLFLDQPIKIKGQHFDYFKKETQWISQKLGYELTFQDWEFCNIGINNDNILNESEAINKALETEDDQEQGEELENKDKEITKTIIAKSLIPQTIIQAFAQQKVYKTIIVGLYADLGRPESDHLCDICIQVPMNERVENTDRFLQAFSRKFNKWLRQTRQ